jgi:hypothetical protein
MELIRRNVSLAGKPMPVEEDLFNQSEVWADELFSIVPESWLDASFARAFKDHTSEFPITAFEVKNAYTEAERDARIADYKQREAVLDDLERRRRLAEFTICQICFGTGFMSGGFTEYAGRQYHGVVKSFNCCDYWERARTKREAHRTTKIERD